MRKNAPITMRMTSRPQDSERPDICISPPPQSIGKMLPAKDESYETEATTGQSRLSLAGGDGVHQRKAGRALGKRPCTARQLTHLVVYLVRHEIVFAEGFECE